MIQLHRGKNGLEIKLHNKNVAHRDFSFMELNMLPLQMISSFSVSFSFRTLKVKHLLIGGGYF